MSQAAVPTAVPVVRAQVVSQQPAPELQSFWHFGGDLFDCMDNGEEDQRTLHAGLPPAFADTVKYAINGWIRSDRIQHMGAF